MRGFDAFLQGERFQTHIELSAQRCQKCKGVTSFQHILKLQTIKTSVKAVVSQVRRHSALI